MIKISLLGNTAVGKSSILNRKIHDRFSLDIGATIGASFFSCSVPIEGEDKDAKLHIWDTAGQERYRSITKIYYKGSKICLVVFDVTEKLSKIKLSIDEWINEIRDAEQNCSIIIIGNKIDLIEGIYDEDIGYDYIKTSAKTGEGINDVFDEIAKIIKEKNLLFENNNQDKRRTVNLYENEDKYICPC